MHRIYHRPKGQIQLTVMSRHFYRLFEGQHQRRHLLAVKYSIIFICSRVTNTHITEYPTTNSSKADGFEVI